MDVHADVNKTSRALEEQRAAVDEAVAMATKKVALAAVQVIQKQIIGGHPVGTPRPTDGSGGVVPGHPSNVTNKLRLSIPEFKFERKGFGSYTALVGPNTIYAHALEYGTASNGRYKYPIVKPTAMIMRNNNAALRIYESVLREAMARSFNG